MKKSVILITTLVFSFVAFSQTTKKALFIGNSYTNSFNLPGLVSSLASSDGHTLITDKNTPGGYTLELHSTNTTTLSKIEADQWDYLVLQDQSQRPSFPASQVQQDVYPFAEILADSVYSQNACAIPLFFDTWGRRDGDPQWDSINTFRKMNWRLFNAYSHMAEENNGQMSPVGVGFLHVNQDANSVVGFTGLYSTDGSHPSIHGSYLAACIFYNVIFETRSLSNAFMPTNITSSEAAYLQEVADHVVYEVDSVKVDFRAIAENNFTFQLNGNQATFQEDIQSGTLVSWDFGDGNTSTNSNPTHSYAGPGSYSVWMETQNSCHTKVISQDVLISSFSNITENKQEIKIFPNPSNGEIHISGVPKDTEIEVFKLSGNLVMKTMNKTINLDQGMYILRVGERTYKIVITQ